MEKTPSQPVDRELDSALVGVLSSLGAKLEAATLKIKVVFDTCIIY